jgi:outer membrane lipoprotein SlyB
MKKLITLLTTTLLVFVLASCAKDYDSSSYSDATAGEAQIVRYGVIVQMQPVTINSEGDKMVGTVAGGGAGMVLGSLIGGGAVSNALGSIGGALVGGAAGSAAGKAAGKQNGMQYFIKLNSGNTISVVQGTEPALNLGQHVIVLTGSGARDRVLADNAPQTETAVQTTVQPKKQLHQKRPAATTVTQDNDSSN